jgi:hypothetical protein
MKGNQLHTKEQITVLVKSLDIQRLAAVSVQLHVPHIHTLRLWWHVTLPLYLRQSTFSKIAVHDQQPESQPSLASLKGLNSKH